MRHGSKGTIRGPALLLSADDLVDDSVVQCLLRTEEKVPVRIGSDGLRGLARVKREDLIDLLLDKDDLFRSDVDIRGLAADATQRLVKHDPRMGQGEPRQRCA